MGVGGNTDPVDDGVDGNSNGGCEEEDITVSFKGVVAVACDADCDGGSDADNEDAFLLFFSWVAVDDDPDVNFLLFFVVFSDNGEVGWEEEGDNSDVF